MKVRWSAPQFDGVTLVGVRAPTVRLEPRDVRALEDRLSIRVTKTFVEDLESTLSVHISYCKFNQLRRRRVQRAWHQAVVKATRRLLQRVQRGGASAEPELRSMLTARLQHWTRDGARKRQPDYSTLQLGVDVARQLLDYGVPLESRRRRQTEFVEVLGLVRRWADRLNGRRRPARYADLRRYAGAVRKEVTQSARAQQHARGRTQPV